MKTIIAAILFTASLGYAACICEFDGTEYEIKKGLFGLVYGTPLKKPTPTPSPTPKPTVTPTATPKPTPTATATPSATPTSTPAVSTRPRGIEELLQKSFREADFNNTEGYRDGFRARLSWNEIQKAVDGPYDWSKVDNAVAWAKKYGKQLGISVAALPAEANPTGLEAAGCKMVQLASGSVPVINDPVYLAKWGKFVKDFGARVNGRVNYVAIGGLGTKNFESHYAFTAADITALDKVGGLEAWKDAAKQYAVFYNQAFPDTQFQFTAAQPYGNAAGEAALKEVLEFIADKYGPRFGVMNSQLNATSNVNHPPHFYVNKYASTHGCGLQFLTNCEGGFTGHDCGGTLEEVLNKGLELLKSPGASESRGYMECYPADTKLTKNAALLKATSAKLK